MPELPEVARTAMSLNAAVEGSELNEVIVHSGRYSRHGDPVGLEEFRKSFPIKVESVQFHGKLIVFEFIDKQKKKWWCWNTLGMSGGWRYDKSKHGHVEFKTSKGSVYFTDARNFGTLKFIDNEKETLKKINSIGPNHLAQDISDEIFKERLMKYPESTMPQVLMNQKLIGGIGNYIKAEVLYRSKISPHRLVKTLSDKEFSTLNEHTADVVRSSFYSRGASIRTYKGMDGEDGNYVFEFQCYGRENCPEGFPVVREQTEDGRTTWWVPQIQK